MTLKTIPKLSAPALAAALIALAGCGGSSSSNSTAAPASEAPATTAATAPATTPATGSALSLSADPEGQLKYNTTSLTAKAGTVSIAFANMSPVAHNVTIESSAGKVLGASPTFQGGSKTVTLALKPGTYKFYCSVPGHRQAGMEGTLTVQ